MSGRDTEMELETEYQGPKRGADRAVLLAHGAGADMHAAALTVVADALADAKIPSLRFQYPYRAAGKKAPDRPAVLEAATRLAASELARLAKVAPERLVLGGRSMGGRYCSLVAARPGRSGPVPRAPAPRLPAAPGGQAREAARRAPAAPHDARGVRVRHARLARRAARARGRGAAVPGAVTFHWLESSDHGFRPLKASGRTTADVLGEVAAFSVDWVRALPG